MYLNHDVTARRHCLAVALANLDAVVLEARAAVESLPPHLLDELEGTVKAHLSRGHAVGGASPLSPRSPANARQAPWRASGSPPRAGRPTAAPADLGESRQASCGTQGHVPLQMLFSAAARAFA